MLFHTYHSPIGLLYLRIAKGYLTGCQWQPFRAGTTDDDDYSKNKEVLGIACAQLDEYFAGKRKGFSVPLLPIQTTFRKIVLREMAKIPYGHTCSYGELAKAAGNPGAVRALGTACKTNPLAIFIPCHRVITSSGAIGQYAGGRHAKQFLLTLENCNKK